MPEIDPMFIAPASSPPRFECSPPHSPVAQSHTTTAGEPPSDDGSDHLTTSPFTTRKRKRGEIEDIEPFVRHIIRKYALNAASEKEVREMLTASIMSQIQFVYSPRSPVV